MSRSYCSYDADWQRRKSVLIRSLFHDIPILSPVEEESNDSSQHYYVPTQEVFPSPPRPYSPLPPLIIEKVPMTNKHDEPEEHYSKLYKKIKIIYKKLFIEKRNFSIIDYISNYSDSLVSENSDGTDENLDFRFLESNSPDNGDFDSIIEDKEARQSSDSTKSNGYGADFESTDTAIIDVVNYTPSNGDGIMISDEEESGGENIGRDGIRNEDSDSSRSSDNKESSRERIDDPELSGVEESDYSIIDDHEMTETEESNEPEDEQSYEKEGSDNENIDELEIIEGTRQPGESGTVRIDDAIFIEGEEFHYSSIDDHEKSESEESNEIEDELQPNNVTQSKEDSFEKELKSKEFKKTTFEERNKLIETDVEPMERDEEISDSSEGPAFRQITTAAMIHFDGSSDAGERESRVYEDSENSVILPTRFRRVLVSPNIVVDDRIEVLTILDENAAYLSWQKVQTSLAPNFAARTPLTDAVIRGSNTQVTGQAALEDSKTTPSFYIDKSETTEEDIEEVATPQLETEKERNKEKTTLPADALEEDDEEISTSQPESAEEGVEGMGSPQPAARHEEAEEIGIPQPEATQENVEEMGAPRLEAPEEEDEEMSSPQPDSVEEDVDGMGISQPAPKDAGTEEMGIPLPEVTVEDVEEMGTPQLEALEEKDEEITTPQPQSVEEDVEGIGSPHPAARDEKTEEIRIPLLESIQEDVEEMGTPRLDSHEEDDEEMTTPQESGEEDIEEMGNPEPADRYKETKATEVYVEEMGSPHPIEQMRTPRPDLSYRTIPTIHRSHSESTSEHTAVPQEQTALTSSTQDCAENNMSELQTSNDMNEILTSIFNESRNKDGTPISGRKRKYVDKSVQAVQTSRVTWDEMRANFFVGTPKIFRLCACADHICY